MKNTILTKLNTLLTKKLFIFFLLVLGLVIIISVNTIRKDSKQLDTPAIATLAINETLAATHLSDALKFRTVSHSQKPHLNAQEFKKLHIYLEHTYPLLHSTLLREKIGNNSLLYTWLGSDPQKAPIALMAHQDVVPATKTKNNGWSVDPFAGTIKDGFIWGRGALDNKGNLISQMEAVELLLQSGFQPQQTVYLILGDDEEVGGLRGAKQISALLKSRGVKLDYVLDEGLLVTEGILPGIKSPVALIGISEKGFATYKLKLSGQPGHSSMPPQKTVIGSMSAALAQVEQNKLPASIRGVPALMFDTLAPEMSGLSRIMMSNLWLFSPLVEFKLKKSHSTNALLRTTSALTIFTSGNRDNVLPNKADATINFRIKPGDTIEDISQHLKEIVNNDNITISLSDSNSEAAPVSSIQSSAYHNINQSLREVFPSIVVAPSLMIATTDSRHFIDIANNIYRFSPIRANADDLQRWHGVNERLSIKNLAEAIRFYYQLLSQ